MIILKGAIIIILIQNKTHSLLIIDLEVANWSMVIVITISEVLLHPLALVGVPADSHGGGDRLQIRQDPIPLHLLVS